jgi:hypothetical protein
VYKEFATAFPGASEGLLHALVSSDERIAVFALLCLKLVLDPVNRDITIKEEVAAKLVVSRAEVFERVMVRAKRHLQLLV